MRKPKTNDTEVDHRQDQIEFDGQVRYKTWQENARMQGIKTHPNYNQDYELVVVCGQEASLLDLIKDNLQAFIKTDLIYF